MRNAHCHDPARPAALREAMDGADPAYAPTVPLAARLWDHGNRAPIISGDPYCPVAEGSIPPPLPSTLPVIGYMGSAGHAADLATILTVIETLMQE